MILVGTSCSNDMMRSDESEGKFETLRTIDQSSDAIGIERQHSNDRVIIIYYILYYSISIMYFMMLTISIIYTSRI